MDVINLKMKSLLSLGVDIPSNGQMFNFVMVASSDKRAVYTIGDGLHHWEYGTKQGDIIWKFSCSNGIEQCTWTEIPTKLKYGRLNTVAMTIPNALADKLCKSN